MARRKRKLSTPTLLSREEARAAQRARKAQRAAEVAAQAEAQAKAQARKQAAIQAHDELQRKAGEVGSPLTNTRLASAPPLSKRAPPPLTSIGSASSSVTASASRITDKCGS
ncbi:hypothetical protein D3C77_638690 [compost metagenome]